MGQSTATVGRHPGELRSHGPPRMRSPPPFTLARHAQLRLEHQFLCEFGEWHTGLVSGSVREVGEHHARPRAAKHMLRLVAAGAPAAVRVNLRHHKRNLNGFSRWHNWAWDVPRMCMASHDPCPSSPPLR